MGCRKCRRQPRVLERKENGSFRNGGISTAFHFPAPCPACPRVYCRKGAPEAVDFIWVIPVMKRMGIFKASSQQAEVSAIVAHPQARSLLLCQKTPLLKKYPPGCCQPLGRGEGQHEEGAEVMEKGKQTVSGIWESAASVEKGRKKGLYSFPALHW